MITPRDLRILPPLMRIDADERPWYGTPKAWYGLTVDPGRQAARLRNDIILHLVESFSPEGREAFAVELEKADAHLDALTVRDHARYMAAAGQS